MSAQILEQVKAQIARPGWTPGRKDMEFLFGVWRSLDDGERDSLEKRLSRIDAPSVRRAVELIKCVDTRTRGDLTRSILKSYLKSHPKADFDWIQYPNDCLSDLDPRVRKAAAQAIGSSWEEIPIQFKKLVIERLIERLNTTDNPSEMKALSDALGKSADADALRALRDIGGTSKNLLTLERDLTRGEAELSEGSCLPERLGTKPVVAWFTQGIEMIARSFGLFLGAENLGPGILKAEQAVTWSQLTTHYLWRSAGVSIGKLKSSSAAGFVDVLTSAARAIDAATDRKAGSPVRIRLGRDVGRSRSFIWEFAEILSKAQIGMINDGRSPHWELRVVGDELVLVPIKIDDQRFSWRDVQADGASDPTIAAALVYLAELKSNERVWDPFCGAGTELILASKIAAGVIAVGTDINKSVIDAGLKAASGAGVSVQFRQESCLDHKDTPYHAIITNPPFGMRTVRGAARALLEEFFSVARLSIARSGRIVMLSHAPSSTVGWAEASGLRCVRRWPIKLGGMECQIQVFKPI